MNDRESLGIASPVDYFEDLEGVVVGVPYGETGARVAFTNQELDRILLDGVSCMLGDIALDGFRFDTATKSPLLPYYVGARTIEINVKEKVQHSVIMGVSIVSRSGVDEYRGLARVQRINLGGEWKLLEQITAPPLREPGSQSNN